MTLKNKKASVKKKLPERHEPKQLSDREYFTLETYEHSIEMERKEIAVFAKNIELQKAKIEILSLKTNLAQINISAETKNIDARIKRIELLRNDLRKAREDAAKRLKITEINWSYCRQTGMIKLPKGG